MVLKPFKCDSCGAEGKITVKGNDYTFEDVVYCPLCGADIFEEDPNIDEE